MVDGFMEAYDESDFESDLEDLEYDEARRRRRRGGARRRSQIIRPTGRNWQPQPSTTGTGVAARLRREAAAGRARDTQLARAVNTTREDVSDVEGRLRKANNDVARLRQLSMLSMVIPPSFNVQRMTINEDNDGNSILSQTDDANVPGVNIVTGMRPNILQLLLFMMMGRGIGTPGRGGSSTSSSNDMMMPIVLLTLLPQLQSQAAGGTTTSGGLDTATLPLILMMAMGGM